MSYYWEREKHPQDATETRTGEPCGPAKFEINISKNGRHVFATDRIIRTYPPEHILDLIKLFKTVFPASEGYRISALVEVRHFPSLPMDILTEIYGEDVEKMKRFQ